VCPATAPSAQELASGKLRAIGVSSKKATYGVRSVREQGLDVDITNWRAVFTGQGVPAARQAEMVAAVKASLAYELWLKTLKQAYWEQSWLSGTGPHELHRLRHQDYATCGAVAKAQGLSRSQNPPGVVAPPCRARAC
jgi:tripartite-type tricarboxylate transporter receptor subunit TctC